MNAADETPVLPWSLHLTLAEYTPAEVEAMTSLSTAMQRDWRHRGFGPKYDRHARFNIFNVAEFYFMKTLSDQGKGPTLSAPYAARAAAKIVLTGLIWRDEAWSGEGAVDIFDRIPEGSRCLSREERAWLEIGDRKAVLKEAPQKREWLTEQLYTALALQNDGWGHQAIFWPTGEFELSAFESRRFTGLGGDAKFGKVDAKFDGPALILDIEAAAEILVDRSPRPWVDAFLIVRDSAPIAPTGKSPRNQGEVVVAAGGKQRRSITASTVLATGRAMRADEAVETREGQG